MAGSKVSALPSAARATGAELIYCAQAGASKALTADMLTGMRTSASGVIPLGLNKARQALSKAIAGFAGGKIICCGDSTTAGVVGGSGSGASSTLNSWPYYLYKDLARRGYPVRYDGFSAGGVAAGDSRVVAGSGWALWSNYLYQSPGNLTSSIDFTPTGIVDTADIYYFDNSSGSLKVQWNAETATTISLTGSNTLKKITVSAAAATSGNVLHIYMSSGFLSFVDCYALAVKDLRVLNAGVPGTSANNISGAPYSLEKVWAQLGGSAYFVNLGINDYGNNNVAAYSTNMQTIITALKAAGDLFIAVPTRVSSTESVQDTYKSALYTLAESNALPIVDLQRRYGLTYAAESAAGWINDPLHPYGHTYEDEGRWLASLLTNI